MKIEKINNNQIKCVLNKNDLVSRHIKVSELAYGTEKAQELFKDMMEQASHKFGFETKNAPLMIEAVPLSSESIMLIITKVDNPEELEDKFVNLPSTKTRSFKKKDNAEQSNLPVQFKSDDSMVNTFFVYTFNSLNDVTTAVSNLIVFPTHNSTLYKDDKSNRYYLTVTADNIKRETSIIVHGVLAEYGEELQCQKSRLTYFNEHFNTLIKDNAISIIRNL